MAPRPGLRPRVLLALACLLASARVRGETPPLDRNFSPQTLHPAVGPDDFLAVEPARPLAHLNFSLGLWASYARAPFSIYTVESGQVGAARARIVSDLVGADLVFALGLAGRLQLGVGAPMTVLQTGEDFTSAYKGTPFTIPAASGAALGDPWVDLKVRVLGGDRGLGVALAARATIPVSYYVNPDRFGGDKGFGAGGRILVGYDLARLHLGLQAGFHWRAETAQMLSTSVGSELRYGAAVAWEAIVRRLTLVAELTGRTDVSSDKLTYVDTTGLDFDVAAKVQVSRWVRLTIGIGTGLGRGTGTPIGRALVGVVWSPDRRDRDRDGIPNVDDKCSDAPEDLDGWKDGDGCPEPDNDGDGIDDARDRCPNEAEDFDGWEDIDGCLDPDNDSDGIADIQDACPAEKEDGKPPQPADGCPADKADSDRDGILDNKDKCPTEPEDLDSFQDTDGCPEPDNDQDGYGDAEDKCPTKGEDFDGVEDDDGCPDPDNDTDGVSDDKDKCPDAPETINGVKDDDGCPDQGPPPKFQLLGNEIILMEKIHFDRPVQGDFGDIAVTIDTATIQQRSFDVLTQVARLLLAHPELKQIRIEAHTDGEGDPRKYKTMTQQRAEAVRLFLVHRGVAKARLVPVGMGADRPVDSNRRAKGRESNRRVEFHIIQRDKPATPAGR